MKLVKNVILILLIGNNSMVMNILEIVDDWLLLN